jgi:DNA-binding transcriptional regulator YhcF (GntR family)
MDLKLNRKNQLPIHTQLKAQLVHLIRTKELVAGTQLPTVRQLAGFLRVNRNTVSKVFSEMEREGYLSCVPGRGTFVSSPKTESKMKVEKMQKLLVVVDDALERAKRLGFSAEEFSLTLYARTQTASKPVKPASASALFVECNLPETRLLSEELRQELSLHVDPILIDDFKRLVERNSASLQQYTFVITTFYHIREVQAQLAETGIQAIALLVEMSLDTLMRLTRLPEGTKVGVACYNWTGSENMKLSIENAGLKHLRLILGCGEDERSLLKMLKEASVILCSNLAEERIRALAPQGKEIIVHQKRLERAGIEMLRSRLMELSAAERIQPKAFGPVSHPKKRKNYRRGVS